MLDWLQSKVAELTASGLSATIAGIGKLVLQFDDLLIIVAIIGVYFMIAGSKKLGTKCTSISILIYFIAEVISKC